MRNFLRAFPLLLAALLIAGNASAEPYNTSLGATIDAYLTANAPGSPLIGYGSVFFSNGVFYNVDPRLVVAIAGVESNFGISLPCAGSFDAWLWLPPACTSNFASYTTAIQNVTFGMQQNYLNQGFGSISAIGSQYCSGPCFAAWITAVTNIYTSLGGDPGNLRFQDPGSPIDFEQFSNSPSYFAAYTTYSQPLVINTGTVTASLYGGVPLSAATNLPADASTTYGTASPYCLSTICQSTIEIDFNPPVNNVSFFLINGNTVTITYTALDSLNKSTQITLPSNYNSGVGDVALPPTDKITALYISGSTTDPYACCAWDFFIDNVSFAVAP